MRNIGKDNVLKMWWSSHTSTKAGYSERLSARRSRRITRFCRQASRQGTLPSRYWAATTSGESSTVKMKVVGRLSAQEKRHPCECRDRASSTRVISAICCNVSPTVKRVIWNWASAVRAVASESLGKGRASQIGGPSLSLEGQRRQDPPYARPSGAGPWAVHGVQIPLPRRAVRHHGPMVAGRWSAPPRGGYRPLHPAGVAQRLEPQPSKLVVRVRFPSPAPAPTEERPPEHPREAHRGSRRPSCSRSASASPSRSRATSVTTTRAPRRDDHHHDRRRPPPPSDGTTTTTEGTTTTAGEDHHDHRRRADRHRRHRRPPRPRRPRRPRPRRSGHHRRHRHRHDGHRSGTRRRPGRLRRRVARPARPRPGGPGPGPPAPSLAPADLRSLSRDGTAVARFQPS